MNSSETCDCGCGRKATETIRLIPLMHVDTARKLGWTSSVDTMRIALRVADETHDEIEGYLSAEQESEERSVAS